MLSDLNGLIARERINDFQRDADHYRLIKMANELNESAAPVIILHTSRMQMMRVLLLVMLMLGL
jgi:hypothetical protein